MGKIIRCVIIVQYDYTLTSTYALPTIRLRVRTHFPNNTIRNKTLYHIRQYVIRRMIYFLYKL